MICGFPKQHETIPEPQRVPNKSVQINIGRRTSVNHILGFIFHTVAQAIRSISKYCALGTISKLMGNTGAPGPQM